jgi:hypothetical protein
MITQKDLTSYTFNCIGDYFCYIVESRINGNHIQVVDLINALSTQQKKAFIKWCFFTKNDSENEIKKADLDYLHNKTLDLV